MRDFGFDDLGFYSVAAVYGGYSIGSFFCSPIVKKLTAKYSLSLASAFFTTWIIMFILPARRFDRYGDTDFKEEDMVWYLKRNFIGTMLIISALICGVGSGLIWVAHGEYIS